MVMVGGALGPWYIFNLRAVGRRGERRREGQGAGAVSPIAFVICLRVLGVEWGRGWK